MDNILIQVRGTKRVIIFAPSDIDYLYVDGDKSLVNNIEEADLESYPLVRKATFYTGLLKPGDCLFIPGSFRFATTIKIDSFSSRLVLALWFHNIKSLDSYAISVNVFWRDLNVDFYDPKDLYGNKDLVPFNRTIGQLAKSLAELEKQLPAVYIDFYARRLRSYLDQYIEKNEKKIKN